MGAELVEGPVGDVLAPVGSVFGVAVEGKHRNPSVLAHKCISGILFLARMLKGDRDPMLLKAIS